MKRPEIDVTFMPSNSTVAVPRGVSLMDAAVHAGIVLHTPCGGQGTCGKCKVRIIGASTVPSTVEQQRLSERELAEGYRLACRTVVENAMEVVVPAESLFISQQRILDSATIRNVQVHSSIRKVHFECPPPDRDNSESDLCRLRKCIGEVDISHRLLCRIPGLLRANDWRGTAIVSNNHCIALEKSDPGKRLFGIAFDVGTTTIVGALFDLETGKEQGMVSCINPQTAFGDDVLTRIQRIREDSSMLEQQQASVITACNRIADQLAEKTGISRSSIYEIVVAGNTTMQQILCGFDPSALGVVPFVPVFDSCCRVHASHLGISVHPDADVFVFGQPGGFVGGDTLACMLATHIDSWEETVVLVDIGTNGEIVLACRDTLLAASTAAGPAFEGARIGQGMRAAIGAIEKVEITDDVEYTVIGDIAPIGICGSGLIDAVAQMYRAGILNRRGKICSPDELHAGVSDKLAKRVVPVGEQQYGFILAPLTESGLDEPVMLKQNDIRQLQLASAAIRAGINIILKRAERTLEGIGSILLAGAFGNFIDIRSAVQIGLLPPVDFSRIKSIGNAALAGAASALISQDEREYAETLLKKTVHVDFSLDPDFATEYAMAMFFPEQADTNGK
jgi:uncharacterized 2Fe-2S/4Fe-4S cluster protein (DUF4445 family)